MTENLTIQENNNKKTVDFRIKYKTEVVALFYSEVQVLARKGLLSLQPERKKDPTQCTFAHSDQEIREKAHLRQNYKTKSCINFAIKGFCPYGARCHYIHEAPILKELTDDGQKTRSNSEESDSSRSSDSCKINNNLWSRMTHNKRIQLIQTLGFDYSIRYFPFYLELPPDFCRC